MQTVFASKVRGAPSRKVRKSTSLVALALFFVSSVAHSQPADSSSDTGENETEEAPPLEGSTSRDEAPIENTPEKENLAQDPPEESELDSAGPEVSEEQPLEAGPSPDQAEKEDASPADEQLVPRLPGEAESKSGEQQPETTPNPGPQPKVDPLRQAARKPTARPSSFYGYVPLDRHLEMPARWIDRPLSLPKGTLLFGLSLEAVFVDHAPTSAQSPFFALGVTKELQLGLSGGLRYDEHLERWTALDPTPSVLLTFYDADDFELGVLSEVVLPVSSTVSTHLRLGIPMLLRLSDSFRLDVSPSAELAFSGPTELSLSLGLGATWQAADSFYLGLAAVPTFGATRGRRSGSDALFRVGTSMGSQERARADLEAQFFWENLGSGPEDHLSEGGGLRVSLRFFPELY